MQEKSAPLRVLEFFAGVGGFRGGLEGFPGSPEASSSGYKVVWSNQYEPSTKRQHASEVYVARWGAAGHVSEDINAVLSDSVKFSQLLSADADVLVGGFPCQDYSVANSSNGAAGLVGKKGVLWWSIYETLHRLSVAGRPVRHVVLENVDRLLKSPTKNRGRDFAIILASLAQLGYAVEWRVVNAADYGYPQRRRRVFIVAHHRSTMHFRHLESGMSQPTGGSRVDVSQQGCLATAFPCSIVDVAPSIHLPGSVVETQESYVCNADGTTRFEAAGVMVNGVVSTAKVQAESAENARTLGDVVRATDESLISPSFFVHEADVPQWQFLKGAKSLERTAASGHIYRYSEGAMAFPDSLDRPGRTIITSEGGSSASRFKHVVRAQDGRLRRLVPEELEDMNGFPRGFTALDGVTDSKRAFFMGNALVTGLVRRIGDALLLT